MDKENTLYIDLKDGRVVIEMRPDLAPNHVAQIKKLAREGKYDGVVFHRVIEGFMAQTGDPTGTGSGGMGEMLKSEFSKEPHVRGSVSMARTSDPNSARSQFFIVFKDLELPRRPVHGVGQGYVGHGVRRQDQARPGPVGLGAAAARQDDQGPVSRPTRRTRRVQRTTRSTSTSGARRVRRRQAGSREAGARRQRRRRLPRVRRLRPRPAIDGLAGGMGEPLARARSRTPRPRADGRARRSLRTDSDGQYTGGAGDVRRGARLARSRRAPRVRALSPCPDKGVKVQVAADAQD